MKLSTLLTILKQVGCACFYYMIMRDGRRWSNWVDLEKDGCFHTTKPNPWEDIEDIIQLLLKSNRIAQYYRLLKVQADLQDPSARPMLYGRFFERCASLSLSLSDQLAILNTRLYYIQALVEAGDYPRAQEVVKRAEEELNDLSWISESDCQSLFLRKCQLECLGQLNIRHVKGLMELAVSFQTRGDRLTEHQVRSNIDTVLTRVDFPARDDDWITAYKTNTIRRCELMLNPDGHVVQFAYGVTLIISAGSRSSASLYLHEYNKFRKGHLHFDIPFWLKQFYFYAAIASQLLGKTSDHQEYEGMQEEIRKDCPGEPRFDFLESYRNVAPHEYPIGLFAIILGWLKIELETGKMDVEEIQELLLIERSKEKDENLKKQILTKRLREEPPVKIVHRLYGHPRPVDAETWAERLSRFEGWLSKAPVNIERWKRHSVLGDLQVGREALVVKYMLESDSAYITEDEKFELLQLRIAETKRLCDLNKQLDEKAYSRENDGIRGAEWRLRVCRINEAGNGKAFQSGALDEAQFSEALKWLEHALKAFKMDKVMSMMTLSQIATALRLKYKVFGTAPADASLDPLEEYDCLYTEQRREMSVLRGLDHFTAQFEFVKHWSFVPYHAMAIGQCLEALGLRQLRIGWHRLQLKNESTLLDPPKPLRGKQALEAELMKWTQRKKAKSMAEIFGAEILIPSQALQDIKHDAAAQELLQDEYIIQTKLDRKEGDIVKLNEELANVRESMRSLDSLQQVMDMRDGKAMEESDLKAFGRNLGESVLIVDYIHLPNTSLLGGVEILAMVYKNGELCDTLWVDKELTYAKVERWARTMNRDARPWSAGVTDTMLKMLLPLVEPVSRFSKPGDIILFSPTGVLHSIPLHAIEVEGTPLIERNPVVYAQNLFLLRKCRLSRSLAGASLPANICIAQGLSEVDAEPSMTFTQRIDAPILQGTNLTKSSFLDASAAATIVHFYGHVDFAELQPLDHALSIRDLPSESVTARDILNHRLRLGAHVNLIGCESGRAKIETNDELLGLATAFFSAGAASVVGTMWSIDIEDGEEFQEKLWEELLLQAAEREGAEHEMTRQDKMPADQGPRRCANSLDLARIFQKTVVSMSRGPEGERKSPYHWAAFTFQGWWTDLPTTCIPSRAKPK